MGMKSIVIFSDILMILFFCWNIKPDASKNVKVGFGVMSVLYVANIASILAGVL